MAALDSLLTALELAPDGDGRFRGTNAGYAPGVVFGGQLIAQSMVAAQTGHPDKRVKTVHTIFARGASPDTDLDIEVDPMHSGRAFASSAVTIRQGDRLCTRSLVLLSADEDEVMRHADPAPSVPPPDEGKSDPDGWDVQIVGDVDIADPDAVGPADLDVWTRFAGAPDDPVLGPALAAYTTDPFLIATAMRPHKGVGQALAHVTLSTGVISHTITFHEHVRAGDWFLLSHHSPYAGHGRSYGRADIFQDGQLVGSFVQDNMIRPLPAGHGGSL